MIRRTLKSGLLATVALLAFMPAAAGVAAASTTAPHTVPAVAAQHNVLRTHQVHYLTGRVATHRARLNVRSGPGTGYRVVGHRRTHRLVALSCKAYGSSVYGNHVWYRLPHHRGYVSAHYVRTGRAVPWC
jgi:uncharacterized protein YraI